MTAHEPGPPKSNSKTTPAQEKQNHRQQQRDTRRQQRQERRQKKRAVRDQKRMARIGRVQQRLQTLRTEKTAQKRRLVFRVIRATLILLLFIPLGALAIAFKSVELLELPFELLVSEVRGTVDASKQNAAVAEQLAQTHTEAASIGLQRHSVMLVDAQAADGGSISLADEGPPQASTEVSGASESTAS